jgi:hypothetical protein
MTTADVKVTPGTGANVATYSISEDAETKQIQRVGMNHLDGTVLTDATGLKISTSQLAAISTTAQPMATGYQLVGTPTDQVVANKVQAQTSGATSSRVDAAASTNATSLKASAGAIIEIDVFNVAAYDVFLKIYNKASAPTVGTDTPTWTIPLKAGTGYSRDFKYGKWCSTGVAYAITKLQVDSDTTVLVAHDVTGTIDWI